MLKNRMIPFAVAALLLTRATGVSAEDEKKVPGLKIGATAPNFELKDQNDKNVSLSDLLKKSAISKTGAVALVFHRSASW